MASYRKPYRIRRKRQILKSRFFWFTILFLIILGGVFYFFIFSDFFQVKKIIVTGEQKVSEEEIKSIVESNLGRKMLFFIPKNIFLADLKKIQKDILNEFPRLAKIEIGRKFPDTINISAVERLSLAIYCHKEQCFLVDDEGVVFERVPEDSQLPEQSAGLRRMDVLRLPKIQSSLLREESKLGDKVVEKELIDKTLEINDKFRNDFKIQLQELSIISEQRLNTKTAEGWEVYFNLKRDLDWQMTQLAVILDNRIPPERRKNLKYIDLRFDKVYIFPEDYNQ